MPFLYLLHNVHIPQSSVLRAEAIIKLFIKSFSFDHSGKTAGKHNAGEWPNEHLG